MNSASNSSENQTIRLPGGQLSTVRGEEFRDAAELPEELLESLLQLQLTPASSEVFWSAFEHWREARGVQEAFLAALEDRD